MGVAVELQRQLPVGDVSARAVEGGGVLPPLALAEHEVGVRGTAETRGAGDHVHRIVVTQLAQVMDQQHGNAVPVRQCFKYTDVPIVVGVGICIIAHSANALQGVDDYETCGRIYNRLKARKRRGRITVDEWNRQVVRAQELKDAFTAQQMTKEEYVKKLNEL